MMIKLITVLIHFGFIFLSRALFIPYFYRVFFPFLRQIIQFMAELKYRVRLNKQPDFINR